MTYQDALTLTNEAQNILDRLMYNRSKDIEADEDRIEEISDLLERYGDDLTAKES